MPKTPDQPLFWARFTIPGTGTFTYQGVAYDRGQLLTLGGSPRDGRLVELEYVKEAPVSEKHLHAQCGVCSAMFVNEYFRDQHGKLRHRDRFADDLDLAVGMDTPWGAAALKDTTGDAEEQRQMQEFPLRLDKTIASQNA